MSYLTTKSFPASERAAMVHVSFVLAMTASRTIADYVPAAPQRAAAIQPQTAIRAVAGMSQFDTSQL